MSDLNILKFTDEELWTLMNNYDAAFTDPDGKTGIESRVSDKLSNAYLKARRTKKAAA